MLQSYKTIFEKTKTKAATHPEKYAAIFADSARFAKLRERGKFWVGVAQFG
jgi:hypothetical protein